MNERFVKEEMDLVQQIKRDESTRLRPYLDCCSKYWRDCTCAKKGKLTIGTGRNLDDYGISADENEYLLANDLARAKMDVGRFLPWTSQLDPVRLAVLVNMCLNMGIGNAEKGSGLLGFKNTLALIRSGDYQSAAQHMLDSKWAKQVGPRANRLAQQMISGEWT